MKMKLKIRRSNPAGEDGGGGGGPYIQAYGVEVTEGMTVLEALLKIAEEDDPTLTFRKSCRSAICGSCAVSVNGFSKLACNTQIMPEYKRSGEVFIEPLPNHTILKDLLVDMDPFWKKIEKIKPYLMPLEENGAGYIKMTSADEEAIDSAQRCVMCGCCNGECSALEIDPGFIGPAALAKAWRFVGDVREAEGGRRRLGRLSDEHGMWDCVRCVHCTQYCPKDVSPLKAIELLRSRAIKEGVTDNPGAKHVEAMANSVKRVGRLDEAAMTFKTLGFLRSLGMIPLGIKMEFHGKLPKPLIFAQIEGMDEVKRIYSEMEKRKEWPKKG